MLVKFQPIFVADTKVIDGYNFAATLMFGEKFRNIIFRSSGGVWVTIYVLCTTKNIQKNHSLQNQSEDFLMTG